MTDRRSRFLGLPCGRRMVLVAAIGTIVICGALEVRSQMFEPPAFCPAKVDGADLRIIEGIPVARIGGSPAEMGRRLGKLLGDQVEFGLRLYLGALFPTKEVRARAELAAKRLEPSIPPRYVEEMRALASAAGVPYEDVLLANTFLNILKLAPEQMPTVPVACSTVAAFGGASADGEMIVGRNLDFDSLGFAHKVTVVVEARPAGRRPFVSVTWPGLIGVLSGMNDDGLVVANMEIYAGSSGLDGTPYPFLYRRLLEDCATVEEATAILAKAKIITSNNLMLADEGDAVVAELARNGVNVRRAKKGAIWAENCFVARGEPGPGTRYGKMRAFVEEHRGRIDLAAVEGLLAELALGDLNLQAIVFRPHDRVMHLASGQLPAADGPYVEIKAFEKRADRADPAGDL